jgi:hypothetical protein
MEPAWYQQGAPFVAGTTVTFPAATAGQLVTWHLDGTAALDGSWITQVYGVSGTAEDLLSGTATSVFNGYDGEPAGTRFLRITNEIGITRYIAGASADTPRMGPQPIATAIDILREIRATDGGRIYDEPAGPGVTMMTRRFMVAATPRATFTLAQIKPPFKPTRDVYLANYVTVKNADAGEITVAKTSGARSTAPPPAGVGESRQSFDVNLYDETFDMPQRASWELARGTIEGRQYTSMTLDLLANPGLTSTAKSIKEGDYIVVTGAAPDDIHLWVVGISETVAAVEREITFECESYEINRVGKWSDGTWRWGTGALALSAPATSTATSWTVSSTERLDLLVPGAAPLDLMAAGERVTCTVIGAVTGTGPYSQTLTVTRSVNGVVKAQVSGSGVQPFNVRRWGLGKL